MDFIRNLLNGYLWQIITSLVREARVHPMEVILITNQAIGLKSEIYLIETPKCNFGGIG